MLPPINSGCSISPKPWPRRQQKVVFWVLAAYKSARPKRRRLRISKGALGLRCNGSPGKAPHIRARLPHHLARGPSRLVEIELGEVHRADSNTISLRFTSGERNSPLVLCALEGSLMPKH